MIYVLKYGSQGKSVVLLQELLNAYGNELAVDQYFGRKTEGAVLRFQQTNSLIVDGIVGIRTWAKLLTTPPTIVPQTNITDEEINRLSNTVLKRGSRGEAVIFLQELLNQLGFTLDTDGIFGGQSDAAIKQFQQQHRLEVDGIVGKKTWAKLFELSPTFMVNRLQLSEQDMQTFATEFDLEVPIVKAVRDVESSGKGYLKDNRPIILFEGHIFWRELKRRGIDPVPLAAGNENVLFPKWDRTSYGSVSRQYTRLEKACSIGKSYHFLEAALASCSWGLFQIMGFNYRKAGGANLVDFITKMRRSELEQLIAFGNFIKDNRGMLTFLRAKNWAEFAKRYNGSGYKQNKYDERLAEAYLNHSAQPVQG
ncbi:MAG: N-acetylmuramidase domain-containing protein [Bacteroidota bacterium]